MYKMNRMIFASTLTLPHWGEGTAKDYPIAYLRQAASMTSNA